MPPNAPSDGGFELSFESFISELQLAGLIKRSAGRLAAFRRKYHIELALVCLYLRELGVIVPGEGQHSSPPSECDLCGSLTSAHGFFVDGATAEGAWANMCARCYVREGTGIGWGVGQLYQASLDGRWRLIAGGDPEVE
jgi:hypothetical protein